MDLQFIGEKYNVLNAAQKVKELAVLLGIYYGSDIDYFLNNESIVKYYGYSSKSMSKIQFENLVELLITLSIQYSNILRFCPKAIEDLTNFAWRPKNIYLNSRVTSKTLIYLRSRIEDNAINYKLDENHFPREKCTYNEELVNAFATFKKAVFAPDLEHLKNIPPKSMTRKFTEVKTVLRDGTIVSSSNKLNRELLTERNILILY